MGENAGRKARRGLAQAERPGAVIRHVAAFGIGQAEMNMAAIADMIERRLGRKAGAQAMAARRFAGERLDAAHAGRHCGLGDYGEHADITGAADMGATAELDRKGRIAN